MIVRTGMGNKLTASTAFPALSLLNTLREPLQQLPGVLMALLVEGRVSLERMNAFMSTSAAPFASSFLLRDPQNKLLVVHR